MSTTAEKEVLQHIYSSYKTNSNAGCDIAPLAVKLGREPLALAASLVAKGWVRDDVVVADKQVRCMIYIDGIEEVDPGFIEKQIYTILPHTGKSETIWNIIDIMHLPPSGFQMAFDLALEMQNRDLSKLLYAFFPTKVMIEMTLKGAAARSVR